MISIPNFTFLAPAVHELSPWNQKLKKIFTWLLCHYFTLYKHLPQQIQHIFVSFINTHHFGLINCHWSHRYFTSPCVHHVAITGQCGKLKGIMDLVSNAIRLIQISRKHIQLLQKTKLWGTDRYTGSTMKVLPEKHTAY